MGRKKTTDQIQKIKSLKEKIFFEGTEKEKRQEIEKDCRWEKAR